MKQFKLSNIKRIFFIYSEASLAVFFIIMALLELICYFALPDALKLLPLLGTMIFVSIAAILILIIYRDIQV